MSKVVFVTPNTEKSINDIPVGTLILSDILKNNGIESDILQFHHFGEFDDFKRFLDLAVELVLKQTPRIVSFYTRCDTYHITLKIAERIKSIDKSIYIVLGGPQSDLTAVPTVKYLPYIDFVCCGEGESTIYPFFSSLLNGTPDLSVPGLVYKSREEIVVNPRPEFISDFDDLPLIDDSLILHCKDGDTVKKFPIETGRGCPFGCTYCSTKTFWNRKYRLKSAERIIDEIKTVHEKFGITDYNFKHDMFTMNREKVIRICKELKNIGFPITWRCSARIDCLDKELIDIMADAGMIGVFIGIETGSPRMQKLINKNLKLDNVYEMVSYITGKGIHVTTSFMFGFPDETDEDFSSTVSLMCKLATIKKVKIPAFLCTFLPGTEMTEKYKDNLKKVDVFSFVTGDFAVEECSDLVFAYPEIFPQYFEYDTELRRKAKHYSNIFLCWQIMFPVYEYLAKKYPENRICDMVYEFSNANAESLEKGLPKIEILKNDKFIDLHSDDEKYEILKEVSRYIIWKFECGREGKDDSAVFAFDVAAFESGKKIEELSSGLYVVTSFTNEKGKHNIELKKML